MAERNQFPPGSMSWAYYLSISSDDSTEMSVHSSISRTILTEDRGLLGSSSMKAGAPDITPPSQKVKGQLLLRILRIIH